MKDRLRSERLLPLAGGLQRLPFWLLAVILLGLLLASGLVRPLDIRSLDFTARAIIALTIGYGAFISEIFRAGIQSIHAGQWEAASSLGVQDVTQMGKVYAASTFKFFETYNIVAFLYLSLTISLSLLVRLLERRLARGRAGSSVAPAA